MLNLTFKEDHISQIPALQLLQKLGFMHILRQKTGSKSTTGFSSVVQGASVKESLTVQIEGNKTIKTKEKLVI